MAEKKAQVSKRYFAQVGSELIEVPAEHVALHGKKGGEFSTSAPVQHYQVRITEGNPDKGPTTTYTGSGASWKEAEAAADQQLPKVK